MWDGDKLLPPTANSLQNKAKVVDTDKVFQLCTDRFAPNTFHTCPLKPQTLQPIVHPTLYMPVKGCEWGGFGRRLVGVGIIKKYVGRNGLMDKI